MAEQALTQAMCDDIRDMFTDEAFELIDQINSGPVAGSRIVIEDIAGPERPPAAVGAEQFKKFWRTMIVEGRLYYLTG
jgi:hypothetical protein